MKLCVIGLGRFGYQVATTLADNDMEVLAIDTNDELVTSIRDKVTHAICLSASNEESLRAVGIEEMDVVIVAMGEDFAQSALITALLKQHFSIPRVITRSINTIHREVLMLIGADEVILPEQESAIRVADMLSLPFNALMRITPTFSLSYRKAPASCVGKQIGSLYEQFHVTCIGKKQKETIEPLAPTYVIKEQDVIVYTGANKDLEKMARL